MNEQRRRTGWWGASAYLQTTADGQMCWMPQSTNCAKSITNQIAMKALAAMKCFRSKRPEGIGESLAALHAPIESPGHGRAFHAWYQTAQFVVQTLVVFMPASASDRVL